MVADLLEIFHATHGAYMDQPSSPQPSVRPDDAHSFLWSVLQAGQALTSCQVGTLFVRTAHDALRFALRTNADALPLSELPLKEPDSGAPVHRYVATHVALSGEPVVIDDVYAETRFDLSATKRFSEASGVRAVSLATVPVVASAGDVVGVLQFVNATDAATGAVVPFSPDRVRVLVALATEAASAVQTLRSMA
jgi:GAF domain-containing protein